MLSYMLPVEEKSSPRNLNLNLNLNGNSGTAGVSGTNGNTSESDNSQSTAASTTKLIHFEQRASALKTTSNDASRSNIPPPNLDNLNATTATTTNSILTTSNSAGMDDSRKVKMTKMGNTKNVTLKRVSFGSSKGSMVETLVFETPTPLPEHAEREFSFASEPTVLGGPVNNPQRTTSNGFMNSSCLDDSGIEMQEELERSKVRVTFFQSGLPQQISPPDHFGFTFNDTSDISLLPCDYLISDPNSISDDHIMTATTAIPPTYDRQMSTESGWDNPFRPGGDLSREADEIVNMIKGGKPITPTGDASFANGTAAQLGNNHHTTENGTAVVDGATKAEASQLQSTQNGTKSPQKSDKKTNGDTTPQTQISNQVIPGPQSASHVVIDDKKKKKCTCCVIQ